jgi:hypothetical protein
MKLKTKLKILAATLVLASTSSWATVISFGTGSGGDCPCSASAAFTVSNGQIVITLTNTLGAGVIVSAGQALSDISFTISGPAPSLNGSSAGSFQFGDINGSGVVTYTATDSFNGISSPLRWLGKGPSPPNGMGDFSIVGNTITMEAIGGGQPSEMIFPFLANGGTYTSANNGVQQHNSYLIGPATFTLDLSGVTTGTTISQVVFSFGTGPDVFAQGTPPIPEQESPEPNSLALLGFAGLLLGFIVRRRQMS